MSKRGITQYKISAERHYLDGQFLHMDKRFDNAGYHFGFSSECAVKHLLEKAGVRDRAKDEVLSLHFPRLRTVALQVAQGRGLTKLVPLLQRKDYMERWSTEMRYARNGTIGKAKAEQWSQHARETAALFY